MYLARKSNKGFSGRLHIWRGDDTACKMASTGGINIGRWRVLDHHYGRKICSMCATNHAKLSNVNLDKRAK